MSGAKRRSGYRKTVMDSVLHGDGEPSAGQRLAVLLRPRGDNLLEVRVEAAPGGAAAAACETALALLPTRFRKTVWVKRGDALVLCESFDSPAEAAAAAAAPAAAGAAGSGPRYLVHTVLYPDQLRRLRASGRWPAALDVDAGDAGGDGGDGAAAAPAAAGAHDAISAGKWRSKGGGAQTAGGGGASLAAALRAQAQIGEGGAGADADAAVESCGGSGRMDDGRRGLPPAYDEFDDEEDEEGGGNDGGSGGGACGDDAIVAALAPP